jgi:putative hydrolase of the HAD superfamily
MTGAVLKCIFLDLGKVLVDIDYTRFADRMRRLTGIGEDELRRAFTDGNLMHDFEVGRCSNAAFHLEVCKKIGMKMPEVEFREVWNSIFKESPMLPDSLISSLSDRAELWAVSNTNPIHFDYISKHYSFIRYFKGFILSYEARSRKPEAAIFLHALKRAGVKPENVLFIDDQLPNVEAARKLGIDALQFVDSKQLTDELLVRGSL